MPTPGIAGHCDICDEDVPRPGDPHDESTDGMVLVDHIRVMHPDQYGDGPELWPDGGPVIIDKSAFDEPLQ